MINLRCLEIWLFDGGAFIHAKDLHCYGTVTRNLRSSQGFAQRLGAMYVCDRYRIDSGSLIRIAIRLDFAYPEGLLLVRSRNWPNFPKCTFEALQCVL